MGGLLDQMTSMTESGGKSGFIDAKNFRNARMNSFSDWTVSDTLEFLCFYTDRDKVAERRKSLYLCNSTPKNARRKTARNSNLHPRLFPKAQDLSSGFGEDRDDDHDSNSIEKSCLDLCDRKV